MKKLLAIVLLLTMVLSVSASAATLKDYERATGFKAMVTSGGIADDAFNSQKLAETIRTATGYDVQFTMFRGVAGAPDMSDEALAYWVDLFEQVSQDSAWTEDYLGAKGMIPAFIVGDELADFLANQEQMYYDLQKQVGLIK